MNCKAKGTRNEHKSKRLLEADGYHCTRAAASLGVFDIIAINAVRVMLVQVKTGAWPSTKEVQAMVDFPAPPGSIKEIHRWRDRAKHPDIRIL